MNTIHSSNDTPNQQFDLLDYLGLLWKWRRLFVVNMVVVVFIGMAIAFLVPRWYLATASVLPPKEQGMFSQLGAASSLLKSISGTQRLASTLSGNSNTYNFLAILKSRTVMEEIVRRFNLKAVYELADSSTDKAVSALEGNCSFDVQPEDNITIEVYDTDAQRAADMANAFVEILNATSLQLATTEARNNRVFIESRLEKVREDLRRAEDELRKQQERSGLLILPAESKSGLDAVAELYALKVRKELELGILEKTAGGDNPAAQQAKAELSEIRRKVEGIPRTGMESLRLYRDLMIQQRILEFIVPLHEQAKVDEQKNIPVILVLDKAHAPERPEKPRRLLVLLAISIAGLLLNTFVVFFVESHRSYENRGNPVAEGIERFGAVLARWYRVK